MLAIVSNITVPLPGNTSSFFFRITSRKCLSAFDMSFTCVSNDCDDLATSSAVGGGFEESVLLRGLCGEWDLRLKILKNVLYVKYIFFII